MPVSTAVASSRHCVLHVFVTWLACAVTVHLPEHVEVATVRKAGTTWLLASLCNCADEMNGGMRLRAGLDKPKDGVALGERC